MAGRGSGNNCNGKSGKTLQGDFGAVEIEVRRDRNGSFEPKILPKHERRFQGSHDKILSMYARGMTTRAIQAHLEEIYGVEVSPSLISEVTDAVAEDVRTWQHRPLDPIYMIVYLDALIVNAAARGTCREPGGPFCCRTFNGITYWDRHILSPYIAPISISSFWIPLRKRRFNEHYNN